MSTKHPVIAITGSSGAGTTSVTGPSSTSSGARGSRRRWSRATRFHRYDRQEMKAAMAEAEAEQGPHFRHFGPEANLLEELEALFREYGETGGGKVRKYLHDEAEAAPYGQEPGTFTPWEDLPTGTDLLFYEGLHGAVVTDKVDVAQHADLLIGVVPIINLEWIQKLHRDKTHARLLHRGGDRHDPAPDARLRELHLPAVLPHPRQLPARAHGRHLQPVHRAVHPDRGRELPGDPVRRIRTGIDFPYLLSMLHDSFMSRPNIIVVPGREDGAGDAADLHADDPAVDGEEAAAGRLIAPG